MPEVNTMQPVLKSTNNMLQDSDATEGKTLSDDAPVASANAPAVKKHRVNPPREIGGPAGPEPTRYGDWEKNGRCSDF